MPRPKPKTRNLTDPSAMKAMAHPVRLALLEVLGVHGPMTATQAAAHIDESPSALSFHLRTLARHGFVEEDGSGTGRQRPWRVVPGPLTIGEQADPTADRAAVALSEMYRERALARMRRAIAGRRELPLPWRRAVRYTESIVWMTAAEARQLNDEVLALHMRYSDRSADPSLRPEGSRPIEVLHFAYPYDGEPSD